MIDINVFQTISNLTYFIWFLIVVFTAVLVWYKNGRDGTDGVAIGVAIIAALLFFVQVVIACFDEQELNSAHRVVEFANDNGLVPNKKALFIVENTDEILEELSSEGDFGKFSDAIYDYTYMHNGSLRDTKKISLIRELSSVCFPSGSAVDIDVLLGTYPWIKADIQSYWSDNISEHSIKRDRKHICSEDHLNTIISGF